MNSYNENLHSSVLSSLESQELTKKQLSAQLDASMFTLYYAEGAEIIAQEKLDAATKMYTDKQHINNVVVMNKNLADNLLLSANQQKTYTTQSVTNMAVCASNIQIAANSIVRLASDVGSIFSIINAADYGTQIYQQAFEAYNLINTTAYHAEKTSQQAMEATASIAEVATSTIADEAKLTNTAVNNLLQVTTADFNAITAILTADNDTKSQASIATRAAEGVIKCSTVEYEASKKAYEFNNEKFNQNLVVEVAKPFEGNFTVSFDYFKSPFSSKDKDLNTQKLGSENPVKNYNIVLVKESKKSFFNASSAENLLSDPTQFKRILPPTDGRPNEKVTIGINDLLDSDNESLKLGENYVAFLLIVFSENYKKEINTFDEYLSAPSEKFKLTHTLYQAEKITTPKASDTKEKTEGTEAEKSALSPISFVVKKEDNPDDKKEDKLKVDYRFLLLPYPDDLLTNEDLTTLEDKIEILEMQEEIANTEEEIKTLNEEIATLTASINQLTESPKNGKTETKDPAEVEITKQKISGFKNALADAKTNLNIAKEELAKSKAKLTEVEKEYPKPVKNNKAFFFNLNLAENVPAGNYTLATQTKAPAATDYAAYIAQIDSTTNDNFGNPLVEDKKYIPVILSFYSGAEVSKSKYTNSLSDWENTTPIAYSLKDNQHHTPTN